MNNTNEIHRTANPTTPAEMLAWMGEEVWADDADRYRELADDVERLESEAGGYPERFADRIASLYSAMRRA